jgi:uncharacterized protein YgiB involved in biofilm formation
MLGIVNLINAQPGLKLNRRKAASSVVEGVEDEIDGRLWSSVGKKSRNSNGSFLVTRAANSSSQEHSRSPPSYRSRKKIKVQIRARNCEWVKLDFENG